MIEREIMLGSRGLSLTDIKAKRRPGYAQSFLECA